MKSLRIGIALLGVATLLLLAGSAPEAFHSGGVAECAGCHSMHFPKEGGSFLLVGIDQSSTCLTCHENADDTGPSSYHVSTVDAKLGPGLSPLHRSPGGDFGWIKKNYAAGSVSEAGETHGHNIVAEDFNYFADTTNTTSPGGSFSSSQLQCTSCHDPHSSARRIAGNVYRTGINLGQTAQPIIGSGSYDNSPEPGTGEAVGVYRILRGLGDNTQGVTFTGVAIAVAPATYNRTEAATQTRVAYGASGVSNTWGNWCATCHEGMHSANGYVHPVDESLGSFVAANYNAYVMSGALNGSASTSYSSLVPFAEGTGDIATLKLHAKNNDSYLNGPSTSDKVMCLSCHRAHASGMMYGLRFDIEYEFMTKGGMYIGSDNPLVTGGRAANQHRGRTIAEWQAAYYDRPATQFASYQRVLCNKCHAKD